MPVERFGDVIYTREKEAELGGEKHTPHIEAPDKVKSGEEFEVTVIVGKDIPHPNTVEHHIKWIQVFIREDDRPHNPVHVATFDLGPTYAEPKVTFKMRLKRSSTLYALEYCNVHGVWENSKRIEVE